MGLPHILYPIFAFVALVTPAAAAQGAVESGQVQMAQMVIERRTVIRITPHPDRARVQLSFRDWREKSAPKCFAVSSLTGILISRPDSIDMVMRGGRVIRARLEKGCPSIDFYSGFYLKPTKDGQLCQDRDTIHSRTGGACEIEKFRTLLPPRP
jgi:hypothetical protein